MKKSPVNSLTEKMAILLAVAGLASLLPAQSRASITLNIGGGQLSDSTGTAIPQGSGLVLLVASTSDSAFSAPSPGSFVSGDDIELGRWDMNDADGFFGDSHILDAPAQAGSSSWSVGDLLILYWYPSLNTSSLVPGAGTSYGAFRTDVVQDGSTIAWLTPADGSTSSLTFLTESFGGTPPDTAGWASYQVTAVPEPISCALAVFGAFFVGARALRWHAGRRSR